MKEELICAGEAVRVLKRDFRKYSKIVTSLYLGAFVDFEISRLSRCAYFFFKYLDDIADGDFPLNNPLSYLEKVKNQIEIRDFDNSEMGFLARDIINRLESGNGRENNPREKILASLDSIIFDYKRSIERKTLSYSELMEYYRLSFFSVIDLCLMGIKSDISAEDISGFCYSQGRVYSVRDLEEDWKKGIINIPAEDLELAGIDSKFSVDFLMKNPMIKRWAAKELVQSKILLEDIRSRYETFDRRTRLVLKGLNEGMLKYIKTQGF